MITRNQWRSKKIGKLLILAVLAVTLLLIGGCNQSSYQPGTTNPSSHAGDNLSAQAADATTTQIAFIAWAVGDSPQGVEDIRDDDPKKFAQYLEIAKAQAPIATELALTPTQPHPIYTPWPTDTPGPSPTPIIALGMMDICQVKGQFVYKGCWRGLVNGDLVTVGVGAKSYAVDHQNGWIVIYRGAYFGASDPNPTIYETPPDVGIVGLQSVDNNVLILVPATYYSHPRSGPTINFDLTTRQFLNVAGTPVPTTPQPTTMP